MAATPGKRRMSLPALPKLARLPSPLAALIVGAICGALVVGLVSSGERGCNAVAGSRSCGDVGLLMLTVILVGAYAVGVLLLRMFSVGKPGLTALFGFMLPLVVILAFLTDAVLSTSMVLILPALSACSFAVGSVFTTALGNNNDGSGTVRPHTQEKSPAGDAADQPPQPPDLPRHAPQREPAADDDATQPLVVGARAAQDETTMLTAAEERQPAETEPPHPESTQPESTQPDSTQPGPTDSPSGEPEQPQHEAADSPASQARHLEAEPIDPEVNSPETNSGGAGGRDEDPGDQNRPSPWRRA